MLQTCWLLKQKKNLKRTCTRNLGVISWLNLSKSLDKIPLGPALPGSGSSGAHLDTSGAPSYLQVTPNIKLSTRSRGGGKFQLPTGTGYKSVCKWRAIVLVWRLRKALEILLLLKTLKYTNCSNLLNKLWIFLMRPAKVTKATKQRRTFSLRRFRLSLNQQIRIRIRKKIVPLLRQVIKSTSSHQRLFLPLPPPVMHTKQTQISLLPRSRTPPQSTVMMILIAN